MTFATVPGRRAALPWAAGVPGQVGPAEARLGPVCHPYPYQAPRRARRRCEFVEIDFTDLVPVDQGRGAGAVHPEAAIVLRRHLSKARCVHLHSCRSKLPPQGGFHLVTRDRAIAVFHAPILTSVPSGRAAFRPRPAPIVKYVNHGATQALRHAFSQIDRISGQFRACGAMKIARRDPGGYNLARNGGSSGECWLRPAQDDLGGALTMGDLHYNCLAGRRWTL
jgi:hypothetical protein